MPDIVRKVENSPAPATYTIGSMIAAERNGYTGLDNVKVHLSNISGKMRHRYSSRSEAERLWRLALSRTGTVRADQPGDRAEDVCGPGAQVVGRDVPAGVQGAGPASRRESLTSAEDIRIAGNISAWRLPRRPAFPRQ